MDFHWDKEKAKLLGKFKVQLYTRSALKYNRKCESGDNKMTKTEVLANIEKEMKVFGMSGVSDNFIFRAITATEWTDVMFGILIGCGSAAVVFTYCT